MHSGRAQGVPERAMKALCAALLALLLAASCAGPGLEPPSGHSDTGGRAGGDAGEPEAGSGASDGAGGEGGAGVGGAGGAGGLATDTGGSGGSAGEDVPADDAGEPDGNDDDAGSDLGP
jgi:hypothetical protein